ncbi:MAG: DUF1697 domain-containing protein [Pseudomonadota bacterium]
MATYVAFLRAVNVGGTGKLPMKDLRAICERLGFSDVKTYIASGNVVFRSVLSASAAKTALENALERYAGKPIGVIVRTSADIKRVLAANPFPDEKPNFTMAILLDEKPHADTLRTVSGQRNEQIVLGEKELYVFYDEGMGNSRLRIAAAKNGTARNMNTIKKMVTLSSST